MEKIFTLTVMMFSFSGILLLGLEIPEELGGSLSVRIQGYNHPESFDMD